MAEIKRVYFVKKGNGIRGGHKHKKTYQALICVEDNFKVNVKTNKMTADFIFNDPSRCLLLEHTTFKNRNRNQ